MNQNDKCIACGAATVFDYIGAGIRSCTLCGTTQMGPMEEYDMMWCPNEQMVRTCYTRLRRFRKYLSRACNMQSSSTVPDETWQYLMERGTVRDTLYGASRKANSKGSATTALAS